MNAHDAHAAIVATSRQTATDKARTAAQRVQLARYAALKASRKPRGVVGRIASWVRGVTA